MRPEADVERRHCDNFFETAPKHELKLIADASKPETIIGLVAVTYVVRSPCRSVQAH